MNAAFLKALEQHPWKGNIRELKNIIERAVILSDDELGVSSLPVDFSMDGESSPTDLASAEKNHIRKILRQTEGNKTHAARLLGIGVSTLYTKLKEYGL